MRISCCSIVAHASKDPKLNTNPNQSPSASPPASHAESARKSVPEPVPCRHCKKNIQPSIIETHLRECEQKKKDKALRKKQAREAKIRREKEAAAAAAAAAAADEDRDADGDAIMDDAGSEAPNSAEPSSAIAGDGTPSKSAKKSTVPLGKDSAIKLSKKRKADSEAPGPSKEAKKKKPNKKETAAAAAASEASKPKLPKPKGPVDVERQCGVPLPNGGYCARSLTCKSHSMGAKRAVPGRSLPYDMLLSQYQKKNQAKQQKAALDANAPLPDEGESGPVDSETERDAVMAALQQRRPQPLAQHTHVGIRQRYTNVRLRDLLGNAFPGSRAFAGGGGGGGAGMFGSRTDGAAGDVGEGGEEGIAPMGTTRPGLGGSRRSSVVEGQA